MKRPVVAGRFWFLRNNWMAKRQSGNDASGMMRLTTVLGVAVFCGAAAMAANAGELLYLSAGGKVSVFEIDQASGNLKPTQEVEYRGAGPMGASPDNRFLYVNGQLPGDGQAKRGAPAIATFRVNGEGKLKRVAWEASAVSAGYLRVDKTGRFLAGNNYGNGTAMVWVLKGGVFRGDAPQVIELEQRAHSAVFSPNNRFLLVPATGPNKVFQLRFDQATGRATPNDPSFAVGPSGEMEARQPRHLVFHPKRALVYTTNERELPGVGVWAWNSRKGTLKTVQNVVTQPKGFDGVITTADLHLTPDARFLYVSNRDITDRKARTGNDSIVAFEVNARNGRLSKIGHFKCEHVPRSFALNETGKFAFVAGQGDDRMGIYRINRDTGALKKVGQIETGSRPSWVHCMTPRGK